MTAAATTQPTGLQALVAKNRKAGRLDEPTPKQPTRRPQLVGLRLKPAEFEQARQLADEDERPTSVFVKRMYLRGLEAYLQDRAAGH
ncbi:hypothetical protein [Melaminivora sp.]|uniref:hypothetical protein n=1 Tax=Melaminivora sp. TaxID=1933032 RepID=UPI0028AC9407|nr:hypothetical protein [Melaminivora sp.]